MTQAEIQHQLYEEIDKLSSAEQLRLIAAAREIRSELPKGMPWEGMKRYIGVLPDDAAAEIIAAIEEDCENIYPDEW